MKAWWEVITPDQDIRTGKFDESVFAADLSDVIADRGPIEYRDPETFFRKTFPTKGLVNLLSDVATHLSGQSGGKAVIQIQTPFGGGKTHSLIALYHFFKNGNELKDSDVVKQVLTQAHLNEVPKVRVVTFVGTEADALKGRTPWGELAKQLENYSMLEEHDRARRAPGKDRLYKLLTQKPTLILMDEIAEYVVKAKDFSDQVIAFFQELTETVKVLPQCVLVVTLPSSVPYGEEGERALYFLQRIFGRVETIYTPVEGEEIYEIIRRRLFEDLPDPSELRKVAESYWEMYQHLGDDVPREVREASYREKIKKAYPFHPELIDILFERWSTFATFQRTRGVLRLLAEVVADLYQQHSLPLIQPAHLNLANPRIRREFLKHIGNEYEGVIASDIAGENAKAQKLDREMGSEYARFKIASGLATAIFFGSFSGSEKKGVNIKQLRLAVLREGIPPAIVADALRRLEEELWFLHVENGVYSFSTQPNLNRIIVNKEEAVEDEHIVEEIRKWLKRFSGDDFDVILWPEASDHVPDLGKLKLVILSLDHTKQGEKTESFVEEILRKCGSTFRVYQNTVLVLVPDANEYSTLRQKVKQLLALRAILDDKVLMRQLSEENKKKVESKIKDLEDGIAFPLSSTYRYLAKLGETGIQWFDLGLPTIGMKTSLTKRVYEFLKNEERLIEAISPENLKQKVFGEDEKEKRIGDIVEAFLKYPHLPMVKDITVVWKAVEDGIKKGTFGIKVEDRIYYKEPVDLDENAILIREVIKPYSPEPKETEGTKGGKDGGASSPKGDSGTKTDDKKTSGIRTVRLQVKVPWDKLSDFVRGVVLPLHNDGAELEIEVHVHAYSKSGSIKQTTLDEKVEETLKQIGAKILGKQTS